MSEYRELSKEITEYSRRFFNEPEWIVKFVESRLASFALEQRRKASDEAFKTEAFKTAKCAVHTTWLSCDQVEELHKRIDSFRALTNQEPSNTRKGGK